MCNITAYDVRDSIKLLQKNPNTQLMDEKGNKFDSKNHNWIIFREFLCLPFSYMTFMIKDKIESKDPSLKGNIFDKEPYNYIYNKKTSFLDSEFVKYDYVELQRVLEHFHKLDIHLLESLVYTNDKADKNSPLMIALEEGNNRNVEIILKYMSMIETNSSSKFISLFTRLLEFKNF